MCLEAKATDCVNITLGPWMLHFASKFLDGTDADDFATKQLLDGIHSIQIRSFEFGSDNADSTADLEAIRKQLGAPGWNEQTRGFALIASEPRQFTSINIVGSIK
jgi:Domain of unknown function (DUF4252)